MNSKRAKAIRRLANECGIGYRPMKKQYNKFARQSEQENKEIKTKLYGQTNKGGIESPTDRTT